ncbi:MAG: hypothetical protein IKI63_03365 [Clostridia bacterium]|nr:hypothetical protein [Clostridia bacterium]
MSIQIREQHLPAPAARLLWLTVAQLVLAFILYIPLVLAPPVWVGMLALAGLTLIAALCVRFSRGARVTARTLWILAALVRWFAVGWCVYECLFLGYDAESCADACASVAAVVCAISAVWLPVGAVAVARGQQHFDGMLVLLASIFNLLVSLFLHGYEPLGIGTILRITEGAPAWIAIAVNLIALILAGAIAVAAFLACPVREPKKPHTKEE